MFVRRAISYVLLYIKNLVNTLSRVEQSETQPETDRANTNALSAQEKPLSHQLLERRLLLDAAAFSTLADSADDIRTENVEAILDSLGLNEGLQLNGKESPETHEIYIVDESVSDSGALLASLGDSDNVYVIDSESDGFVQLGSILSQLNDVDAK